MEPINVDLSFDIRGYLKPHQKIQLSIAEFKENFVIPFDEESSRHEIFNNFERYLEDFKVDIGSKFKQYVNGSFVTNKKNPRDLDVVNIVDYRVATEKYDLLRNKFLNRKALKAYKIDAYMVRIYPKEHKDYNKSLSDLLYWEHWFGNSKKNRAKKRFPKGFVELSFD